jgi:hypothetical protein
VKGACVTESEDVEGVWHSVGHLTLNQDAYLVIDSNEFGSIVEGELFSSSPSRGHGGLPLRSNPVLLVAGEWELEAEFDEDSQAVGKALLLKSQSLSEETDKARVIKRQDAFFDLPGPGGFWHLYSSDGKPCTAYIWTNLNPLFTTTVVPTNPERPLLGEIDEEDLEDSLHFLASNGGWESAGTAIVLELDQEIIGVYFS